MYHQTQSTVKHFHGVSISILPCIYFCTFSVLYYIFFSHVLFYVFISLVVCKKTKHQYSKGLKEVV